MNDTVNPKSSSVQASNEVSLLEDPKERAEHLMLLDLGRNDVGREIRDVIRGADGVSANQGISV